MTVCKFWRQGYCKYGSTFTSNLSPMEPVPVLNKCHKSYSTNCNIQVHVDLSIQSSKLPSTTKIASLDCRMAEPLLKAGPRSLVCRQYSVSKRPKRRFSYLTKSLQGFEG